MKFRIAMDTNVIFSALYFGGKPGTALELVIHKEADLIISEYIRDEFIEVAQRKKLTDESFRKLLGLDNVRLVSDQDYATEKNMRQAKSTCRDRKDVPILAFAIHGFQNNWLDYLISGDPDLLTPRIANITKSRVISPAGFLEIHEKHKG